MLRAGNPQWRDYELSASIQPGGHPAGLAFRCQGPLECYRLEVDPGASSLRLVRVTGSLIQPIAQARSTMSSGSATLTVSAVGPLLQAYLDGRRVLSVSDPTHESGSIGLWAGAAGAGFADVKVVARCEDAFSIVVLPDTQEYVVIPDLPHLPAQARWIAANRATSSIAAVLHEGDVVDKATCQLEWQRAARAMAMVDRNIPTAIATGNHDLIKYLADDCGGPANPTGGTLIGTAEFDRYFPLARYSNLGAYQGSFDGSAANSYQFVDVAGLRLMLLTLEFGPRDTVLQWASAEIDANPDRTVILLTHDYLADTGDLRGSRHCVQLPDGTTDPPGCLPEHALPNGQGGTPMPGANTGEQIWDKLVGRHPTVLMVISGHVAVGEEKQPDGTVTLRPLPVPFTAGRRIGVRADGSRSFELMANYQNMGHGSPHAYLRLLTFDIGADTVTVTTYSPTTDSYLTDDRNQFTLTGLGLPALARR